MRACSYGGEARERYAICSHVPYNLAWRFPAWRLPLPSRKGRFFGTFLPLLSQKPPSFGSVPLPEWSEIPIKVDGITTNSVIPRIKTFLGFLNDAMKQKPGTPDPRGARGAQPDNRFTPDEQPDQNAIITTPPTGQIADPLNGIEPHTDELPLKDGSALLKNITDEYSQNVLLYLCMYILKACVEDFTGRDFKAAPTLDGKALPVHLLEAASFYGPIKNSCSPIATVVQTVFPQEEIKNADDFWCALLSREKQRRSKIISKFMEDSLLSKASTEKSEGFIDLTLAYFRIATELKMRDKVQKNLTKACEDWEKETAAMFPAPVSPYKPPTLSVSIVTAGVDYTYHNHSANTRVKIHICSDRDKGILLNVVSENDKRKALRLPLDTQCFHPSLIKFTHPAKLVAAPATAPAATAPADAAPAPADAAPAPADAAPAPAARAATAPADAAPAPAARATAARAPADAATADVDDADDQDADDSDPDNPVPTRPNFVSRGWTTVSNAFRSPFRKFSAWRAARNQA